MWASTTSGSERELYLVATDLDTCERIVLGGERWADVYCRWADGDCHPLTEWAYENVIVLLVDDVDVAVSVATKAAVRPQAALVETLTLSDDSSDLVLFVQVRPLIVWATIVIMQPAHVTVVWDIDTDAFHELPLIGVPD